MDELVSDEPDVLTKQLDFIEQVLVGQMIPQEWKHVLSESLLFNSILAHWHHRIQTPIQIINFIERMCELTISLIFTSCHRALI